ncbi:MAG: hypothetical protein HGA19_21050 [Oscillochloris sp.]|nr:hypothetical protein [Oscillochloris sp.]
MYNGNGNGGYTSVGGFRIKPVYLYVAGIIAVVVAIYLVMRFLNTSLALHFGAFAGVLLIIANLRELIGMSYTQRGSTALLNLLVGGGLIFAWLAQFFGALLWIPAILLVGIATPLIFGRATVYKAYISTAQGAVDGLRRTIVR